jgi:hypothetical protein
MIAPVHGRGPVVVHTTKGKNVSTIKKKPVTLAAALAKPVAKTKKAKAPPQHARPTVRVQKPMGMQARGR